MNESEDALRERIDETRVRVGHTIEQIGDRVNPHHLKARAREEIIEMKDNVKRKARSTMHNVEHGVTDTGRSIWATIKGNPVPAGLIGVGVAWLVANRKSGDSTRFEASPRPQRYETSRAGQFGPSYAEPSYGDTYDRTSRVGTTYGESVDMRTGQTIPGSTGTTQWSGEGTDEDRGLREKVSDKVHSASDRVSDVAHDAQTRVSRMAHEAKDRAHSVEHRVEESLHDNPVAAGAMALAIGMAAGLIIPETGRENRAMGRTRDRAMDKAGDVARRASEKVHDAAREAAGESARHMVDEVWPDGHGSGTGFSEPGRP